MALVLRVALVALISIAAGLAMTWLAVERGHGWGAVRAGPWTGWPKSGTTQADPYAKAVLARTGEIPLGLAEGLTFIARTDSTGDTLSAKCNYKIRSPIPAARYWSMTVLGTAGQPPEKLSGRYGLTSSEIVRGIKNTFAIALSSSVQQSNWLPVTFENSFIVMLRLYDTPVSATSSALQAGDMPTITKGGCR